LRSSEAGALEFTILGLDPGSLVTGWGVIALRGGQVIHRAHGVVAVRGVPFPARLGLIHAGVAAVVEQYRPQEIAVERVFMNRNVESALKLGQARGAALAAALADGSRPVTEHAATQVKQAITGTGRAEKAQVQHMVVQILGLEETPSPDAADALAIAVCHAHQRRLSGLLGTAAGVGDRGLAPAARALAEAGVLHLMRRGRGGRR
jgi:crossover junction endodeoxyribonuclease RuvC